jgi:hypothetical protein
VASTNTSISTAFFDYLFGEDVGYLCVVRGAANGERLPHQYYAWPAERSKVGLYVEEWTPKTNLWFCTTLLSEKKRKKEFCLPSNIVWADLDFVHPTSVDPPPSCILQTSPDKYQAFWRLDSKLPADVIEEYAKRITYSSGADKGGWGLTKLMRVPQTINHKYESIKPVIEIKQLLETLVPTGFFEDIKPPQLGVVSNGDASFNFDDDPVPDVDKLPDVQSVIYAHRVALQRQQQSFANLFINEPSEKEDWSARLWRLINVCFECGMDTTETFTVALNAKCNKYERDNRPVSYLWRDVLKAQSRQLAQSKLQIVAGLKPLKMPQLVDPDLYQDDAFVKDYKTWAAVATDAPIQYHELCAYIGLSAVVTQGLRLETNWGNFRPHLWGLLLGESTLTRKTTSMNLIKDMLIEIEPELIVASGGSIEGIISAIAERPKRVSMFFQDEVSGLFDSMNKKEYLAGMAETFTLMYDVPKHLPRVLRRETIILQEPYFMFFGGGIRDRLYSIINEEYVLSGFMPRFLVVSGENDLSTLRATGPPTQLSTGLKDRVVSTLSDLRDVYTAEVPVQLGKQHMMMPRTVDAKISTEGWEFFADMERQLVTAGHDAHNQMVALPTMQRLAFSTLKMAMLTAATRRGPSDSNELEVTVDDIKQSAFYIQQWGVHSIDLVNNAGRPSTEKILDRILRFIKDNPDVLRSTVMQRFRLGSKEMRDAMDTLVGRGLVVMKNTSNGGIKLRSAE